MKIIHILFLLATGYLLTGCDGYGRTLHVKSSTGGHRPLFSGTTTIYVKNGSPLTNAVSAIASELKMTPNEGIPNRWEMKTAEGYSFTLALEQEPAGWVIYLIDWPTTERSKESRLAEKRIREELKTK